MSSCSHRNGVCVQFPTHSGNCAAFLPSLMAWMESHADESSFSAGDAISVLAAQLGLTPRQAEVLHWIAEGKTNQEIATILMCSVNTVKAHLKDIFKRLGLHSRTAAAACAYHAHIRHARERGSLPGWVIPEQRRV